MDNLRYDVYLFDWDGTLCRTLDIWLNACHEALNFHGVQISKNEIGPRLGQWELMLKGVPNKDFEKAKRQVIETAHPQVLKAPLYPNAKKLLDRIKSQHKRTGLITATDKSVIDKVLATHGLADYFDVVVTSNDVKELKPHPEGIKAALSSLGADPKAAVMIGDSDKDLGAAKNAGVDSMLFYPDSHAVVHDRDFLESFGPVQTINAWSELL